VEDPGGSEGFLPPDPGPDPEAGTPAARQPQSPPPHVAQPQAPQPQAPQPPPPPPPQTQYQPPPQPGWAPPPGQPYGYGGYSPPPAEPDNNPAVVGFSLSMAGLGLPFITAGLSSIISLGLSIAGVIYSRKGRQKVAAGETRKHDGLAQAGFWCGIAGIVLSALATLAWIAFIVALAVSEDFRQELEDDSGGADGTPAVLMTAVRVAALALS